MAFILETVALNLISFTVIMFTTGVILVGVLEITAQLPSDLIYPERHSRDRVYEKLCRGKVFSFNQLIDDPGIGMYYNYEGSQHVSRPMKGRVRSVHMVGEGRQRYAKVAIESGNLRGYTIRVLMSDLKPEDYFFTPSPTLSYTVVQDGIIQQTED